MKLWIHQFTPLLVLPGGKLKHFDLNPGALVVPVVGLDVYPGSDQYQLVKYVNADGRPFDGWVSKDHISEYFETLPKDCVKIPFQTANPNDFEQYLVYDGVKQVNACGEICVAHILGLGLGEVLENWKLKSPTVWKRVTGKGKWAGTGPDDLINLFGIFGVEAVSLSKVLKRYTMSGLQKLLDAGDVITSCNIGYDGRFKGRDILHWATIDALFPERQWGRVHVMNPAPNRIEEYSWSEWLASCGQSYGVFIPEVRQ